MDMESPKRGGSAMNEEKTNVKDGKENADEQLLPLLHKTIRKVSEDIEAMRFNTAISALMILVNEFERRETVSRNTLEILLRLLSPFAPHIAEELWERLGNPSSIVFSEWPSFDESLLQEERVECAVQVNGKLRARLSIVPGLSEQDAVEKVLEHKDVQKFLSGKERVKTIFVPDRLINFVVRDRDEALSLSRSNEH
ncbi:MAG: class I tRNA ligase family protein [Candidatus Moraniibacteriota bacterium]|nr:MAG: class I tRNA ligase family protein [Candidatus Moranbacteria bacterium]